MMTKIYMVLGGAVLVTYLSITARGVVFSGTDDRPSYSERSQTGRNTGRRTGFWWGVGGFRGGK